MPKPKHCFDKPADNLFADGIMSTSKVVRSILFAWNQLLRMEELAISAGAHFIHNLLVGAIDQQKTYQKLSRVNILWICCGASLIKPTMLIDVNGWLLLDNKRNLSNLSMVVM